MKNIKLFLAIVAGIGSMLFSCKKDDPNKTIIEALRHRWTFQKEYHHENYSGIDTRDTLIGVPGEYADFRSDNKLYYSVNGQVDTSTYSLVPGYSIELIYNKNGLIIKDTAQIILLDDANLQLYFKKFDPAPDYYEYTDYYTR